MLRTIVPVVAAVATAALLPAQSGTRAFTSVELPCNASAPTNSLYSAVSTPPVFLPDAQRGFAIEIESAPLTASWVAETNHAGFTGSSYYRWNGPNLFSTAGQGVLTYRIMVPQDDRYRVVLHNRHNHPDSSLENDCWIRANGSGWTKLYSNVSGNSNVWNFHSRFDPGHGYVQYQLSAGLNTIELSARSAHFMIDRIHVFPMGTGGYETTSVPISQREGSRPILGQRWNVVMGDPNNTAGLTAGSTVAFWMLSSEGKTGSCGVVVPGFGARGAAGEFLLDTSVAPVLLGPVVWNGPNSPARFWVDVPSTAALSGARLHTQGLLFDTTDADIVLTRGLDGVLGSR